MPPAKASALHSKLAGRRGTSASCPSVPGLQVAVLLWLARLCVWATAAIIWGACLWVTPPAPVGSGAAAGSCSDQVFVPEVSQPFKLPPKMESEYVASPTAPPCGSVLACLPQGGRYQGGRVPATPSRWDSPGVDSLLPRLFLRIRFFLHRGVQMVPKRGAGRSPNP